MPDHVETEFKLRATGPVEVARLDAAIREAGFGCRAIGSRRHVDTYFDDELGSLQAAGIGLRIRDDGRTRQATGKQRGQRSNGLFVRTEVEVAWPDADAPRRAALLPGNLRDMVEPFVLDRPLTPVLRLATTREVRSLRYAERDLAEVTLDHVEASHRGHGVTFTEIEIEVLDDVPSCERLAAAFVEQLPVQPAEDDKPTHAAVLLGQHVETPPKHPVTAEMLTGEALVVVARRHVEELRHAEVAVRGDEAPEHLHTMRVAVRRLRGLVHAFRGAWPDDLTTTMQSHLRETGRQLGVLRDLDAGIGNLAADIERLPEGLRATAMGLLPWIETRRREECARLLAWLRSDTRLAAFRHLVDTLGTPAPRELAVRPITAVVAKQLERLVDVARERANTLPPDLPFGPAHALRIATKRLRYLAEEFAELPGHDYTKSLTALADLQSDLGTICDHEQATRQLLAWIPQARTPAEAAALGGLATLHTRAAQRARRIARRTLARTNRKKVWRRFQD